MAKTPRTPEEEVLFQKRSKTAKSNVRRAKCHERSVAKWLQEWTGVEFRRRRVEGRDSKTIERESTSDVIPVKGESHCAIEAKCGAVASFAALMDNPKGTKFTEWWHQVCYDCTLGEKAFKRPFYPMMFFRPYPNQNWVAVSARLFAMGILKPRVSREQLVNLIKYSGPHDWTYAATTGAELGVGRPWFPHFLFDAFPEMGEISFNIVRTNNKKNYIFVPLRLDAVVMCRWKDFAANVDPVSFFAELPYQNYGVEGTNGVLPEAQQSGSDTAECGTA
jgi:hypothetical protein